MTFLNAIMLLGLAAVAIPIIIHILNRRRAKVVEWGAMQFLEASLASRNRRILLEELMLMLLRCLAVAALAFALARPFLKGRILLPDSGAACDLAVVLDGSMSMLVDSGGRSNFQRAIEEAHQLVDVCRPNDAVCVILAGATPQTPIPSPVSDRRTVHEALDELTPARGSMNALDGLYSATLALAAGTNPGKKIVLISDGQNVGWELSAQQRWAFLGNAGSTLATPPAVIVRTLEVPRRWRNAAVSALTFSRAVIGTDRPVRITATVANTGTGALAPEGVELRIDGAAVEQRSVGAIAEGASSSAVFEHQFKLHGPHVVTARLCCEDDLPADNETTRVVDVLKTLPVLIVEGEPSGKPLAGDAAFLVLALAPPAEEGAGKVEHLIAPTVVPAADVASVKRFSDYAAVVLANVPRLPAAAAKDLAAYAAAGGGVLIAPGEKADKEFYNNWTTPDGKRLSGCVLVEIRSAQTTEAGQERFAHIAPASIDHPALKLLSDPAGSDLPGVRVKRHWTLAPDSEDALRESAVSVGGSLDNGAPWLVQRKLARGFVLTLAFSLDRDLADLAVQECYVPLVHELLYYLAAPSQQPMNVRPGEQIVYAVRGQALAGDVGEMVAPDGKRTPVKLQQNQGRWQAAFAATASPGLYRLALPDRLLGELATRPAVTSAPATAAASAAARGARGVPFIVLDNPEESRLDQLTPDDYKRAAQHIRLVHADNLGEVIAAVSGGVPGGEIWQHVALALLLLLLAETVATRLIAMRRKAHLAAPVAFGTDQVDAEAFRAHAREILAAPLSTKDASVR